MIELSHLRILSDEERVIPGASPGITLLPMELSIYADISIKTEHRVILLCNEIALNILRDWQMAFDNAQICGNSWLIREFEQICYVISIGQFFYLFDTEVHTADTTNSNYIGAIEIQKTLVDIKALIASIESKCG